MVAPWSASRRWRPRAGENSHRYPRCSCLTGADSLSLVRRNNGEHEIRVGDLGGAAALHHRLRILEDGLCGDGYLLFGRDETLLALAFDATTARAFGDPMKVSDARLRTTWAPGWSPFGVSNEGTLVFGAAAATRGYAIFSIGTGGNLATRRRGGADNGGRLSRDGRRALIAEIDPEKASTDIYIIDLATGARSRVTSDPGWDPVPRCGRLQEIVWRTGWARPSTLERASGGEPHAGRRVRERSRGL